MMEQVYEISPEDVVVPEDRHRKHFDKLAGLQLMKSIERYGQFVPGVCTKIEDEVVLVAGQRRLIACEEAKVDFKYLLKEEIQDSLLLEELEIEENIQRQNFTWQEEVKGKARLQEIGELRKGKATPGARGGHTIADTAQALGESKGLVSQDLELAMWMEEIPEVAAARNKTEAKKIVKRLKQQVERRDLLDEAKETVAAAPEGETEVVVDENGKSSTVSVEDPKVVLAQRIEYFTGRSLQARMEDHLGSVPAETYDVVCFDPPWGVGMGEVNIGKETGDGTKEQYEDDPDKYRKRLGERLQLLYSRMAQDSHLYMFFGIVNFEFVYAQLEAAGFVVNRMPIFWYKQGSHVTRNPEVWPGRAYEPIAFARKGRKKLAVQGREDVIVCPTMKKANQDHPDPKHPTVYVDLLRRSCAPGDRVYDPMSGSGMFGLACEHLAPWLRLDWTMTEKKKVFHELGIMNLLIGYGNLKVSGQSPTVEAPKASGGESDKYEKWGGELEEKNKTAAEEDFHNLEPGTPEWKAHWKACPEDQDAMLAWARERKEMKMG